jgi:hypothetical protein
MLKGFGKMRRARDHVGADVTGQIEMVALEVGDQKRGARGPPFMLAVGLDDARAGGVQTTPLHQAVASAAQGIVQALVGERERVGLPGRILRMSRVTPGQAEANIGRHPAAACDMRHQSVEHDAAGEVLVENEIEEIAQKAPGLRDAETDRALDKVTARAKGIAGVAAVAQIGDDVARRGESKSEHRGIARGVGYLIERAGIESASRPDDFD